ncbi:MAG: hypothetical protein HWD82_07715 [Flavobacteriaceae bacterium]|nr:hypothetical protein [Flavobacteriaceae bacterium]
MKFLKYLIFLTIFASLLYACGSSLINNSKNIKEEPVKIANDSLEYEIIIIDPGFTNYINAIAQPRGFYSQKYMEIRNIAWVLTWNQRARNLNTFNPNIYQNEIDYDRNIDYGYEVNYLLFNYFLFAQQKYNMDLGGGFRRQRIN